VLFKDLKDEHARLSKKAAEQSSSLQDLMEKRQDFELTIERCQHWLNQAEVALSSDVRTTNLSLIQEQLNKVNYLVI
jgi:nesprin-1